MITYFFNFILYGIGDILALIVDFITTPILRILTGIIPDFTSFFTIASNFITNYFLKGFQWVKMAFIHICNINTNIFNLVVNAFLFLITIYGLILSFKLAYNLWAIFHASQSKN